MTNESLKNMLKQLLTILKVEKEALIKNEGAKIEELVAAKEELVKNFEANALDQVDPNEKEIIALITEIKELQETNLMLTKQAMSYADTFISAFQKEANKELTYSKKGKDKDSGSASILNQSL